MKKRTYKQMQNRLYREIKRRMMLERMPVPICKIEQRKIETMAMCYRIDNYKIKQIGPDYDEFVKREIAFNICDKLLEQGYFIFKTQTDSYGPIDDYTEIMGKIDVVRPGGTWE